MQNISTICTYLFRRFRTTQRAEAQRMERAGIRPPAKREHTNTGGANSKSGGRQDGTVYPRAEGHHQDLSGRQGAGSGQLSAQGRRDPRADGRERRRKIDLYQGHHRRTPRGGGRDVSRRQARRFPVAAGRAERRHRRDLSACHQLSASDRCGEHLHGA